MTVDLNKGIKDIVYNHLNLPERIYIASSEQGEGNITYIYDATGVKLKKIVYNFSQETTNQTIYAGNYIYEDNGELSTLKFFNQPEGYVQPKDEANIALGFDYVYQYKDHLGNIRLSYKNIGTASNPNLEIQEENNYYPFGMKHKGYNNVINGTEHPYGFNGKEEQKELGLEWLDFGARNYDPALGRWMNLDPLAEDMRRHSPYNFAFNNPLRFIDPDGMAPFDLIVKGDVAAFKEQVSQSTGGFYNAVVDSKGNVTLEKSGLEKEGDGMFEQTAEQKAFTSELSSVIDSKVVTEIESVSSDPNVTVGDIIDNKIDMADIDEFDKAGAGASSSAAVLTHELVEQHEKAKAGGVAGTYPAGAKAMHKAGIQAEDRVNGSRRMENPVTGVDKFYKKDGTIYTQTVQQSSGTVKVTKKKIQ